MPAKKNIELKIGDNAPDFTLAADDGSEISLKDYIGKKVVLYFYPKDMTPGCTKEACSFRDNYKIIKDKGAEILGVSADDLKLHKIFSEKLSLPFPLLSDVNKKVSKAYGVWKRILMFAKVFYGIERTTFVIDEAGKITAIFRKVRVKSHTKEILKNL